MPFDYMHVDIPGSFAIAPDKARQMYRHELRERAGLLRRLGYPKEDVLQRLKTNLTWDWECNPQPGYVPELEGQLTTIVDEVFAR